MRSSDPMRVRPLPHVSCHVVNRGCKAPPALAWSRTRAKCYACGESVCVGPECSRRVRYYRYGRRRLCAGCVAELAKDGPS